MRNLNTVLITLLAVFLIIFLAVEIFDIKIQTKNSEKTQISSSSQSAENSLNVLEQPEVSSNAPTITQLQAEILSPGTGDLQVVAGDQITVHYAGFLTDGTLFDSSLERGQPFSLTIGVGQVIPGWDQGVIGMLVNEKRRLYIPAELAYGAQGIPDVIPPNSSLIFEIELISIDSTSDVSTPEVVPEELSETPLDGTPITE